MPSLSKFALVFLAVSIVLAAPVPQLAGEGAAANSILSDTDDDIGYGTENAEDNIAALITSIKRSVPARRQLAGEGAAADSILTDTDNGVGYGVEDAEDNIAALISSAKGSGSTPTLPKKGRKMRRQLDKISNGAGAIGNAAGLSTVTDPVVAVGDSVDSTLTSGVANAGASVGSTEESALESAGSSVPRL